VLRGDSGFCCRTMVQARQEHNARFSITVPCAEVAPGADRDDLREAAGRGPYWQQGMAYVAEIPYHPFGRARTYWMIVRRVEEAEGGQPNLHGIGYL
jgi:hypothetical protein